VGDPDRGTNSCVFSLVLFKIEVEVFLHEELGKDGLLAGSGF